MKKLLRFLTVIVIIALLVLYGISYSEKERDYKPATEALNGIVNAGRDFAKNVDRVIDESGIKGAAATILEKGADILRRQDTNPPNENTQPYIIDEDKKFV